MEKDELYRIIGQNIKKYRLLNNNIRILTQELLAEYVGVSTSLIRNLESNKTVQGISINTLYKISIVLNVPISKLMEEHNNA